MAKGSSFTLDKNARNNCICLFIAMAILGALTFKGQDSCRTTQSYTRGNQNAVSSFMLKYMHPCEALTSPRFKAPNSQISQLIGEPPATRAYYRHANPKVRTQRSAAQHTAAATR